MTYVLVKWIHILSATVLFGTGVGSAFYVFMATRGRNLGEISFAMRSVVIADWLFTTPAIILQLLTGIWMMQYGGWTYTDPWIVWALALFIFVGICWLPVVWMQIRMRDMAMDALNNNTELPLLFWKMERWWFMLGSLAFPAVVVIFYLMVAKPG